MPGSIASSTSVNSIFIDTPDSAVSPAVSSTPPSVSAMSPDAETCLLTVETEKKLENDDSLWKIVKKIRNFVKALLNLTNS